MVEFLDLTQALFVPNESYPASVAEHLPYIQFQNPSFRATFPQNTMLQKFQDDYFPGPAIDQSHHLAFFLVAGFRFGDNPKTWDAARKLEEKNMKDMKKTFLNQGDLNLSFFSLAQGAKLHLFELEMTSRASLSPESARALINIWLDQLQQELCECK